jgi:anti-sigma factor RsiW
MSCQEVVELVTDYLEGELSPDDNTRFEQHIQECLWCARYLEQMRVTIETVGRLDEESISPEARDSLLVAFSAWKS